VTRAILDDHLLRDLLAEDIGPGLGQLLERHEPATTNLFLYRLSRSVVSASGGALTGSWKPEHRQALGRRLLGLEDRVVVVPMQQLAFRMAEIADGHRVSTLGAEAVAAAEHLEAPLCVWEGDDGPGIRSAAAALDVRYKAIKR